MFFSSMHRGRPFLVWRMDMLSIGRFALCRIYTRAIGHMTVFDGVIE